MNNKQNPYIHDLAMKLANDGANIIEKAFNEADFNKNKTQNLHDSYGSAVYYNGELYPKSTRYLTKLAAESKYDPYQQEAITGRRAIFEFFQDYTPSSDGMQLVIAVAIFYGSILEKGTGTLRRKYKVITQVGDDVMELATSIKGAKVQLMQDGKVNG